MSAWQRLLRCLTLPVLACLVAPELALDAARAGVIEPRSRFGVVAARGVVRGPNGAPIFAEFDENGAVRQTVGEAVGALAGAFVISGEAFRAYVSRYRELERDNPGATLLRRSEYEKEEFLDDAGKERTKPALQASTRFVLVSASHRFQGPGNELVLMEAPFDPRLDPPATVYRAILLNARGDEVLHRAEVNIGYRVAFFEPAGNAFDPQSDRRLRRRPDDALLAPVVGVGVNSWMTNGFSTTDEQGNYTLRYYLPPCEYFDYSLEHSVSAEIPFEPFNPKSRNPMKRFFVEKRVFDFCAGRHERPVTGLSLAGLMAGLALQREALETALALENPTLPNQQVDLFVDAIMLSGEGYFANTQKDQSDRVPLGEETTYAYTPTSFERRVPERLDLDADGEADRLVELEDDTVGVFLGNNEPEYDESGNLLTAPDVVRLKDTLTDLEHQGLLEAISADDLAETDLYVFRTSNDQLITSRQGLGTRELDAYNETYVSTDEAGFSYRMLIRTATTGAFFGRSLEAYQQRTRINPDLVGEAVDFLRVGEQVRIIAINRPTGYIGSATAEVTSGVGGRLDFDIPPLVLRPPNIKIRAERMYEAAGLRHGGPVTALVGFEGSGLASDRATIVTSEWLDHDGTPLPPELPGYAGRLASVVAPNKLQVVSAGDGLAHFEIRPGKQSLLVRLPENANVAARHLYIHVCGYPPDRAEANKCFVGTGAGEGALAYRPRRYVPVRVPIFPDVGPLAPILPKGSDKAPIIEWTAPLPAWPTRPEMQFSVFDLDIEELTLETALDEGGEFLTSLDLHYELDFNGYDPLTRFGPDRKFALGLGFLEAWAEQGEPTRFQSEQVGHLRDLLETADEHRRDLLKTADEHTFLSLQLYQSDEEPNRLYEFFEVPLLLAQRPPVRLKRTVLRGQFDAFLQNAGASDVTDSIDVIAFALTQPSKVRARLLDEHGEVRRTLVPAESVGREPDYQSLGAGGHAFVVSYQDVAARLGVGQDFEIEIEAVAETIPADFSGDHVHRLRLPGTLMQEISGRNLGQIVAHDVLIQDGSLNLNRPDIESLPGRGPTLSFVRTYSNLNDGRNTNSTLGPGWSHNMDISVTPAGFGTGATAFNVPAWVPELKGRFFDPRQIPKDCGQDLSLVRVSNGGLFKKRGGDWYPQRGRHGTLEETSEGLRYTEKDGTAYQFDQPQCFAASYKRQYPVRYIEDRNGNRLTFEYHQYRVGDENLERVTKIADAVGRSLGFEYTQVGTAEVLTRITGPDGIEVVLDYNTRPALLDRPMLRSARRAEREEKYVYRRDVTTADVQREHDNLVGVEDANGHETRYEYFEQGDLPLGLATYVKPFSEEEILKKVTYPDGAMVTFAVDASARNRRTVTDARGSDTTYTLNLTGNPLRIEEPLGKTTLMTWSIDEGKNDNVMTSLTDALGRTTRFEHDAKGNVTVETDPRGKQTVSVWNQQFSLLESRTDRNENTTHRHYDARGNLEREEDAEGHVVAHSYNAQGERTLTTDARGHITRFAYDIYGNLASISEPEGSVTRYENDLRGRRAGMTDPNGNVTRYEYDTLDRQTAEVDPDGYRIVHAYDRKGNRLTEVSKRGLRLDYRYDERDRVVNVTRSLDGASQGFAYDPNGNLTVETDWKDQPTRHEHDELNRRTGTTNRAGDTMQMAYDLVGNKTSETDYEGRTTRFEYDELDRVIKVVDAMEGEVRTAYDDEANVVSVTDQEGRTTRFVYDRRYLRTKTTDALLGERILSYDENGNLIGQTDEEGRLTTHTYDKQNRRTETTDALGYSTAYSHDANGNVVSVRDARQHETTTDYDALDRPVRVVDPEGYETLFEHDADGNQFARTDGNGNVRTAVYDTLNRVLLERDAVGGVIAYEYDRNGNQIGVTNPRGFETRVAYDALDRPAIVTAAAGKAEEQVTETTYDRIGNVLAVKDPRGLVTETEYDDLNRVVKIIDADMNEREMSYDSVGNLLTEKDELGRVTIHRYDELDRLTETIDPLGQSLSFTYDKVGNRVSEDNKRGTVTTHEYDQLNRLLYSVKPVRDGYSITMVRNQYDGVGNLVAVTDAKDNRTEHEYSPRNLSVATRFADGATRVRTYDGVGNLLTERDEVGQVSSFKYDRENRLVSETNAANETRRYAYDLTGNRTRSTMPLGDSTRFGFDGLDRLVSVIDALNNETTYEYDRADNQTAHVDANGNRVEYAYDTLNRRTAHTQLKAGGNLVTRMEYDAVGNLTVLTDAKGQRTNIDYDALNREILRTYPDVSTSFLSMRSISREYDPNGNIVLVTEVKLGAESGLVTDITMRSYDLLDRPLMSSQRGRTVTYAYDDNGNRTGVWSEGGATAFDYDTRNRLVTAIAGTATTTYQYFNDGKRERVVYANGTQAVYGYDNANRVSSIVNVATDGTTLISRYRYRFDANGNRLEQRETQMGVEEVTTYEYDALNRMIAFAVEGAAGSESSTYTYDAVGNRVGESVTLEGEPMRSREFRYDETHWLTSIENSGRGAAVEFAYDANGNTIAKLDKSQTPHVSTVFGYDVRNQMVSVAIGARGSEMVFGRYDYNADGMRVRHLGSDRGDIEYLYDDASVLEERDAKTDKLIAHYRYANQLVSVSTLSGTQFYHFDALGSTTNLSDVDGQAQVSYRLDPWGGIREQEGESINRQIFTGKEFDRDTGLVYFGARYYDPDSARFLTQDLYLGDAEIPPSLNRYLYAYSNPTVYIDRYGFQASTVEQRAELGDREESISQEKNSSQKYEEVSAGSSIPEAAQTFLSAPKKQSQKVFLTVEASQNFLEVADPLQQKVERFRSEVQARLPELLLDVMLEGTGPTPNYVKLLAEKAATVGLKEGLDADGVVSLYQAYGYGKAFLDRNAGVKTGKAVLKNTILSVRDENQMVGDAVYLSPLKLEAIHGIVAKAKGYIASGRLAEFSHSVERRNPDSMLGKAIGFLSPTRRAIREVHTISGSIFGGWWQDANGRWRQTKETFEFSFSIGNSHTMRRASPIDRLAYALGDASRVQGLDLYSIIKAEGKVRRDSNWFRDALDARDRNAYRQPDYPFKKQVK